MAGARLGHGEDFAIGKNGWVETKQKETKGTKISNVRHRSDNFHESVLKNGITRMILPGAKETGVDEVSF